MAINPTSEYLLARGSDGTDVWSLATAERAFRISDGLLDWQRKRRRFEIRWRFEDVEFSSDNWRLAIRFPDRPVQLWDIGERSFPDHPIRLWDLCECRKLRSLDEETVRAEIMSFSPNGDRILLALKKDQLVVFDTTSGRAVARLKNSAGANWAAFSPDGTTIVVGCGVDGAELCDANSGAVVAFLDPPRGMDEWKKIQDGETWIPNVPIAAFSPTGEYIVSGARDLNVWSA